MSNPLSNLKKSRKTPLPATQTGVPYRNAAGYTADENKLLEAIIRKDVMSSLKDDEGKTPRTSRDAGKQPLGPSTAPTPAPSDHDLMGVMMSRLTQLEKQVHLQTRQIIDKVTASNYSKDKKIETLERKLSILRSAKEPDSPSQVRQLEQKCLQLQEQILDMEMFLADYGMMWVGDKSLSSTDMSNGEDAVTDRVTVRDDMWSQGRWALLLLHGWVGGWVGGE
ncbi:UBX domain-containing protein 11 [Lamellibrachia satsuma]|nr:UBX domain-containing protein 11 [Lamellibrachia satsuma]